MHTKEVKDEPMVNWRSHCSIFRLHEELRLRETALREELQSKEAEISGLREQLRELKQQGGAGEVKNTIVLRVCLGNKMELFISLPPPNSLSI